MVHLHCEAPLSKVLYNDCASTFTNSLTLSHTDGGRNRAKAPTCSSGAIGVCYLAKNDHFHTTSVRVRVCMHVCVICGWHKCACVCLCEDEYLHVQICT